MIQLISTENGKCLSVRFRKNGFDAIYKKKFFFIQFGAGTIKWLFIGKEPPKFLKQVFWKTTYQSKLLFLGTTKRPLKIGGIHVQKDRANQGVGSTNVPARSCF